MLALVDTRAAMMIAIMTWELLQQPFIRVDLNIVTGCQQCHLLGGVWLLQPESSVVKRGSSPATKHPLHTKLVVSRLLVVGGIACW